jgi:hypothetical protein
MENILENQTILNTITQPKISMYLWISHGETVSGEHNFYPVETKFQSLVMYSRPFQGITGQKLFEMDKDICRLLLGSCPFIPIVDKATNKKQVFLPPLRFVSITEKVNEKGVVEAEDPNVVKHTGLYYFEIEKTGYDKKHICKVVYHERLLQHQNIIDMYGSGNYITYSTIFKLVTDDCKTRGVDPKDVVLGIYSCHSTSEKYVDKYDQKNIRNLVPQRIDTSLEPASFYNTPLPMGYYASLAFIPFKQFKPWEEALGTIKTQGCGLNVLSYYDIIPENRAREETMCLSLKGTSIFRIVDYIETYLKEDISYDGSAYAIYRYPLQLGLTQIASFMSLYSPPDGGYAIICKMYDTDYQKGSNVFSQLGHTISFAKKNDGKIYLIDPQGSIFEEITGTDITTLTAIIQRIYNNKAFIDIIYTVHEVASDLLPSIKAEELKPFALVPRLPDITYGGVANRDRVKGYRVRSGNIVKGNSVKSRRVKGKTRKMKGRTKGNKGYKRNRKSKKNSRVRSQHGGELDEFEKFMIETDKKNNIETVLTHFE